MPHDTVYVCTNDNLQVGTSLDQVDQVLGKLINCYSESISGSSFDMKGRMLHLYMSHNSNEQDLNNDIKKAGLYCSTPPEAMPADEIEGTLAIIDKEKFFVAVNNLLLDTNVYVSETEQSTNDLARATEEEPRKKVRTYPNSPRY
jgi:hypothetical protein